MFFTRGVLNEFIWRPVFRNRACYQKKAYFKKYGISIEEGIREYGKNVLITEAKSDN